jgi:5-formyltetrahydrofolate cyclo-ligase
MTKSELRKIYLERQKSLSPKERETKSREIADLFFQSADLTETRFLHCFIAIQKFNEIDTSFIFERLWTELPNITTVVPRVVFETGEMENLVFGPDTELAPNTWQIREPLHNEYVSSEAIDVVLVPGLAFDLAGHRVGYGKGFYDRFLSKCRPDCLKIGLSYFSLVEKISDAWDADMQLDLCLTPETIFETQRHKDADPRS